MWRAVDWPPSLGVNMVDECMALASPWSGALRHALFRPELGMGPDSDASRTQAVHPAVGRPDLCGDTSRAWPLGITRHMPERLRPHERPSAEQSLEFDDLSVRWMGVCLPSRPSRPALTIEP